MCLGPQPTLWEDGVDLGCLGASPHAAFILHGFSAEKSLRPNYPMPAARHAAP